MERTKSTICRVEILVMTSALFIAALPVFAASKEIVLHSFGNNEDGMWPYAGVIVGRHRELYGTTISGGAHGYGAVFELQPGADGKWTQQLLHSFQNDGKDGYWPFAAVISDPAGNLYGTTAGGGRRDRGTVFKLTRGPKGKWSEELLYQFAGGMDGATPYASLVLDAGGKLYGTTYEGGNSGCSGVGCGTVFQLAPRAPWGWAEKVLHRFQDNGQDGHHPYAGLIFDAAGNVYGTTAYGPVYGYYYYGPGTVFRLTPGKNGKWIEKVLYTFCSGGGECVDGTNPFAGLSFDDSGNLYGTTLYGGSTYGNGTVFELASGADGEWTESVLHTFCSPLQCADGYFPYGGVTFDSSGNLYGTTTAGTTSNSYCSGQGCGIVFQLVPGASGQWSENVLHSFTGEDGGIPYAGLVFDASGNLYSTTSAGGVYGNGTVFRLTP